jgi:valyl-tRNA synthetase
VQGRDIKLGAKNLEQFRNFTNKLYNATNYLLLNSERFDDLQDIQVQTPLGLYIQSELHKTVKDIKTQIDTYKFNEAALSLYSFVWTLFCDWAIEYSKADKDSIKELGAIYKETLKLVSVFMPFIADYLYHRLDATDIKDGKSLMVMKFPDEKNIKRDIKAQRDFEMIKDIITSIRRAKVQIDMGNSLVPKAYIDIKNKKFDINSAEKYILKLAKVQSIELTSDKPSDCVVDISDDIIVYIPTQDIDTSRIKTKLENQKAKLQKEFDKLGVMLNNKKFISNAPEKVLYENKEKYDNIKQNINNIKKQMENIG